MADYASVLAELSAQRERVLRELAELETAIAAIGRLSGLATTPADLGRPTAPMPSVTPAPRFEGMTLPQAVETLLRHVGRPVTTKEVEEALRAGGMRASAKSFSNQVYNVLYAKSKDGGILRRENNRWMLRANGEPSRRDLFVQAVN